MRRFYFLAKSAAMAFLAGLLAAGVCIAQQPTENLCPFLPATPATPGHPHPQPRPQASEASVTQEDGITVLRVKTAHGCFAEVNPYLDPPGSNLLPTIFTNAFDGSGHEMPNTLPSTPTVPYNLHDGLPVVSALCGVQDFENCPKVPQSSIYEVGPNLKFSSKSPTDDFVEIFDMIDCKYAQRQKQCSFKKVDAPAIASALQRGIDILEGNPIADRLYSGLPLLHYKAMEKVRTVSPIADRSGKIIGGNVNIHQVWYDTHVESDVAFLDPTPVAEVPWTITYTIDVLSRGNDDFSPFVMYFDDPALSKPPMPHIAMDQTFFNMEEGTRTVFKIKMAPGKYYNLTYNWGWRAHPPRVQVTENATKRIPPNPNGKTLVQWEEAVFGGKSKEDAIAQLGDMSPEKRMWAAFRAGKDAAEKKNYANAASKIEEARQAFEDWRDRTKLPKGVQVDPNADLTLFYANNTIYGEFKEGNRSDFPRWETRSDMAAKPLKVSLINGDYFEHGYQNVDFGGARGWENQFQSSVSTGGSGPWFTFGRVHWWMNIPMMLPDGKPLMVPAAKRVPGSPDKLGRYKVEITYSYEPSRRLRFYQFDPMHHDVAIFSIH